MEVVLASNDQGSFSSSTWSTWADSPFDLRLVAKDGALGAHCGLILPLSKHLGGLVEATGFYGPAQVVLPDTSLASMTAVKDLIYKGCCHLDTILLPEILEAMSLLGVNVVSRSFVMEAQAPIHNREDASLKVSAKELPPGLTNWPLDDEQFGNDQGKISGNSSKALMAGSMSLEEGMVFPSSEDMIAYVSQWSQANLSPVSSCGFGVGFGGRNMYLGFRCPHKLKTRPSKISSKSTGKRKPRWNVIEPADCPFVIKTRKNKSDGSFTVTKAQTYHRGHEVSEKQFKKYRLGFQLRRKQSMPRKGNNEEDCEVEMKQNQEGKNQAAGCKEENPSE